MITKTKNAARQPGGGGPMFLNEGWSHSRERRQLFKGGFRTAREAERAMVERLHEVQNHTYTKPTKQTVTEYLRAWLDAIPFT